MDEYMVQRLEEKHQKALLDQKDPEEKFGYHGTLEKIWHASKQ